MFQVELWDETQYEVGFQHFHAQQDLSPWNHITECRIENGEDQIFAIGYAYCSRSDNFDKNIGRKIALQRALKNGDFERRNRILFWLAYHRARGNKW